MKNLAICGAFAIASFIAMATSAFAEEPNTLVEALQNWASSSTVDADENGSADRVGTTNPTAAETLGFDDAFTSTARDTSSSSEGAISRMGGGSFGNFD